MTRNMLFVRPMEVEIVDRRIVFLTLSVLPSFASQQAGCVRVGEDTQPIMLDSFVDGQWVFIVDRRRGPRITDQPSQQFPESEYGSVSPGTTYVVVLSDQGRHVSVGSSPLVGSRSDSGGCGITFELTEWAGGRFVVLAGDGALQAELTIYGSGIPIIQSERGSLVPKP